MKWATRNGNVVDDVFVSSGSSYSSIAMQVCCSQGSRATCLDMYIGVCVYCV